MGQIEKYVNSLAGNGINNVHTYSTQYQKPINSVQGYVGTAFEVAKNGESFVGLQYSAAGTIRDALKAYVASIQAEVDKLDEKAKSCNVSEAEAAVVARYVEAIAAVFKAYNNSLSNFGDKMYEYAENYNASFAATENK